MKKELIIILSLLFVSCSEKNEQEQFVRLTDMIGEEAQIAFSPNGNRIAFSYSLAGNNDIYIKELVSPKLSKVTATGFNETRPSWSPDGKILVYQVEGGGSNYVNLHNLNTGEITPVKLANRSVSRPSWSPDGEKLVLDVSDENGTDIYLYNLEEKVFRRLTDNKGAEFHFGFSPDGKYVGYNKRGSTDEDLFALSIDGEELINITNHAGHEWYPQWSPDGESVLFYSTWGDEMTEVWVAALHSEDLKNISNNVVEDFGSRFSPDGKEVVFISKRDGHNDLYVYNFGTEQLRRLEMNEKLKQGWPIWSPDGRSLAYSTNLEEPYLYKLDLSSGAVNRLTDGHHAEESPAVDPSGKFVAYSTAGNGSESSIMLLNLSTGSANYFFDSYKGQFRPQFSHTTGKLSMVESKGGSIVTNNIFAGSISESDTATISDFGGIRHFVWTKDDEEIIYAYDSAANYTYDIWKLNVVTGQRIPLLQTTKDEVPTSISVDGEHFLFHSDITGENKIYKMPISGGFPELIEHELVIGWDASYSADGQNIVFVSDNNEEQTDDLYIMNRLGGDVRRLTNDRFNETSPKFMSDGGSVIFSARKGSRDIWLYKIQP